MIGFAQIAAGAPSSASPLTAHYMNNTLGIEQASMAAYYAKGLAPNPTLEVAQDIATGAITHDEGVERLLERWNEFNPMPGEPEWQEAAERLMVWDRDHRNWNGADPLEVWEERRSQEQLRLDHRLDILAERIGEGLINAPLAVVKPGTHPLALAGLGIETDGLLSKAEIDALLVGRHSSGKEINEKTYAKVRQLPVNSKTGEQRLSTPIGSYDFTITPHKSVSVAFAFSSGAEQGRIYDAHIRAAREAMGYLTHHIARARLGDGGKNGYEQGHVAVLEFVHTTARRVVSVDADAIKLDPSTPGDPDLHLHAIVPNAVFCESGRVGSLDTAGVRGLIFEVDGLYHARLAQLLRSAGFDTDIDPRTNTTRMTAVPDLVSELFSKRSRHGEAFARLEAAAKGVDFDSLPKGEREDRIKRATQSWEQRGKGQKDDLADVANWREQARETAGWHPQSLYLYGPPRPELTHEQRHRQAYELALPVLEKQFEHEAVITQWNLRAAASVGLIHAGIDDTKDIDAVTKLMWRHGVRQDGEMTALSYGHEPEGRRISITTELHERHEREFVTWVKEAAADTSRAVPADILRQKVTESGLDFSGEHGKAQLAAIERAAFGGKFNLIVAAAGAGKTTSMQPLNAAWQELGRNTHGASLAWRQADDLISVGIDKSNLKAFSVMLDTIKKGETKVNRDTVMIIDEFGLLGTKQVHDLMRLRKQHDFTVVALGDDKQAVSVTAGNVFDLSRRALGDLPTIETTVRQQSDHEKRIVGLFRQGEAWEALSMKREDGTAEMVYGAQAEVIHRVAKLYAERLKETGHAPTISAPTNNDAHLIGQAIREERRSLGLVGPDQIRIRATDGDRSYGMDLAAGDHIRLFESTRAKFPTGRESSIGRNGSVVEVVDVTEQGLSLKGSGGKVGFVAWDKFKQQSGRVLLAYGDATTIHSGQGSTSNEHIFALPSGSQAIKGDLGYSANTRHRHAAYIVTSETAERVAVRRKRAINDVREVSVDDKWAAVATALAYQPVRDSALSMFDRVDEIKRGSVQAFHHAVGIGEANIKTGVSPSQGHEHAHARTVDRSFRQEAADLIQRIAQRARNAVNEMQRRVPQAQRTRSHAAQPTVSQAERDAARSKATSRQMEHRPEQSHERDRGIEM